MSSITPDSPANPTIFERILALEKPVAPEITALLVVSIAQLESIPRDMAITALCRRAGVGRKAVLDQIKVLLSGAKQREKQRIQETKTSATVAVREKFKDQILLPINSEGQAKRLAEHLLIETESGSQYIEEMWHQKRLAPAAERELRHLLIENAEGIGLNLGVGGDQEAALWPVLRQIRADIEREIQHGTIGKRCKVSFGPWLDKVNGILHTKTDLNCEGDNILILKGKHLVTESPQPKEDWEAWNMGERLFGDNFVSIVAHILCAITNENPKNKHILCLYGTAGGGKSTVANWIAQLIEGGTPVSITASGIEGSWPIVFSTRTPIFDNVDNNSFSKENQDILAAALTSETVTVRARYTPSGLTESLGYPIATSIHEAVWGYYDALKSRAIILRQNFSQEIWDYSGGGRAESIIERLKLHLWWLVEQFVVAILSGKLPPKPGNNRNTSYARARFWLETTIFERTVAEAEAICEALIQRATLETPDDASPFLLCFSEAMTAEFGRSREERRYTSEEIAQLMKQKCNYDDLDDINVGKNHKFTQHRKLGSHIRYYLERHLVQGRIADWSVTAKLDSHTKRTLWHIQPM